MNSKFLSKTSFVVLSGVVVLILSILLKSLNNALATDEAPWGILSLQFAFTPEKFARIVSLWDNEALKIFRKVMGLDYLYPLAYSLFLAGLMAKVKVEKKFIFFLPFAAALFDYVENTLHLLLINEGNPYPGQLVLIASLFAMVKWALVLGTLGIIGQSWLTLRTRQNLFH